MRIDDTLDLRSQRLLLEDVTEHVFAESGFVRGRLPALKALIHWRTGRVRGAVLVQRSVLATRRGPPSSWREKERGPRLVTTLHYFFF